MPSGRGALHTGRVRLGARALQGKSAGATYPVPGISPGGSSAFPQAVSVAPGQTHAAEQKAGTR